MAAGDQYAGFFLAYRAALVKLAMPIVGCRMHAEDVVQEAFLRITERRSSVNPIRHPIAFIFQVVRHLAVDRSRRLSWKRAITLRATLRNPSPPPPLHRKSDH